MVCPECNKFVSPFDDSCPHCKKPLKGNPVKDYEKKTGQIVKDAEARAEDTKEQIRSGFKKSTVNAEGRGSYSASNLRPFLKEDHVSKRYDKIEHLTSENSQRMPDFRIRTKDILKLIRQRKDVRVQEMKSLVFGSPYLTGQPERRAKMEQTDFFYRKENMEDEESFEPNAYAWYNRDRQRYEIHLLDGYLNFLLAVESFFKVKNEDILIALFLKMFNGKLFLTDMTDIVMEYIRGEEEVVELVEYAFIPCFETIAHELGHICLGHCQDENLVAYNDISRSDERKADDFASDVKSSLFHTGLKKTLLIAEIKCDFGWALKEEFDKMLLELDLQKEIKLKRGSHPCSDERIRNSIRASADLAEEIDISEKWYDDTKNSVMAKIKRRLQELKQES